MKINIKSYIPIFLIGLSIVLYVAGFFFITCDTEPLLRSDIAQQKEYTYEDSDGEEHEDVSLIKIQGIGKILCYRDVYKLSVTFWLVALWHYNIRLQNIYSKRNKIHNIYQLHNRSNPHIHSDKGQHHTDNFLLVRYCRRIYINTF